ncbi:glycosyltransferase family 4 protein [Chitinophagaceae bacterium LWZ2-11]
MKNILIISPNFPPEVCGVGDYTFELASYLSSFNNVGIICSDNEKIRQKSVSLNFNVYPIIAKWNWTSINLILKKIEEEKPDYILVQYVPYLYQKKGMPFFLLGLYWLLYKKKYRVITFFHELWIPFKTINIKWILLGFIQRCITTAIAFFSAACITSIDFYKERLKKINKNIFLIPIGSNINRAINIDLVNAIITKFELTGNKIIIVFGSRRYKELINLLTPVLDIESNMKLVILGKTQINKEHQIDNKRIVITGYLSSEDIAAFLSLANVYIAFDPNEGNKGGTSLKSGALAAAFRYGLPIIGTSGNMNDEILLKESAVIWSDFRSSADLIDKIQFILNNTETNKSLEKSAISFYKKYLDWKIIASEYGKIFNHNF